MRKLPDEVVEKVARAMEAELHRQARNCVSMPYVGELFDDEITIDGDIELTPLARAALSAIPDRLLKPPA